MSASPGRVGVAAVLTSSIGVSREGTRASQEVGRPFEPPGHKIHSYRTDNREPAGENSAAEEAFVEYEIYKGSFAIEELRQYHERIQVCCC
jgi:hypothetical protein